MFQIGFEKIAVSGDWKAKLVESGMNKRLNSSAAKSEEAVVSKAEHTVSKLLTKGFGSRLGEHVKTAPKSEARATLKALRWTRKYK